MNVLAPIDTETHRKEQLQLRDWVLLPALALLTISVIAFSTEMIARWLFPASQTGLESCFVTNDPSGTAPARPNSVCSERLPEDDFVAEYKFNSRGDRDDLDLEAKRPGTFRIVMIGSSFAMGLFVPRDMSFAALLPQELSMRTGRNIEVYNEAKGGRYRGGPYPIKDSIARFGEVLSAQPDMILWVITPMDIENSEMGTAQPGGSVSFTTVSEQHKRSNGFGINWDRLIKSIAQGRFDEKARYRWEQSRSSLMLKHFLIASESPNQYAESYLKNEDDAEFLKKEPSTEWQDLLRNFESQAEGFERKASSADVPFVAVFIPNRAQCAMISTNSWPSGYDPYKLDDELSTLIDNHGGTFIDILPEFRDIPYSEQYYFPVDGHLNAQGHAMIARLLSNQLASGGVPSLDFGAHLHQTLSQGK